MDIAELWADALESGRFEQTCGYLNDEHGYCCLGVLCELAIENGVQVKKREIQKPECGDEGYDRDNDGLCVEYGSEYATLPREVQEWAGLSTSEGMFESFETIDDESMLEELTALNDTGTSFQDIAKLIRSRPKGLFVDAHDASEGGKQ